MILLFGAFVAGLLTVLAPCVLPLLPIIIGGSVTGDVKDKKRPVVIAISLAVSIIFFTLLLKVTTLLINVPPQFITYFSGGIIVALGLAILFPGVYARLIAAARVEQNAQKALAKGYNNKRSLIGPIITGAALGPVFSSCSPVYAYILATVLPVDFGQAFALMISYVIGLTVVLLLIGYFGQRFISRIKFASDPKGWFQRVLAIIFIIVGVMIVTGYDKRFQTYVSQNTPFDFDAISSSLLPDSKNKVDDTKLFNVQPYAAAEFTGVEAWLNGGEQSLEDLKGKVVLVDFWTYSCINCIRNNPYLEKLYQTYKDDGFVVVGLHAPEFAFEKIPANVAKAVKDQKLSYPVGLDNEFATWNAYENRSWPTSYLIDAEGQVRRVHEGEGEYVQEELAIRQLLTENGASLDGAMAVDESAQVPVTAMQTAETYLGTRRASNYVGSPALGAAAQSNFSPRANLEPDFWTLGGNWEVQTEKIIARGGSTLRFNVKAKDVYVVGGSSTPQQVRVTVDGQPASQAGVAGADVKDSVFTIGESQLYRIVSFPQFKQGSVVELSVPAGVELNVFTFGS